MIDFAEIPLPTRTPTSGATTAVETDSAASAPSAAAIAPTVEALDWSGIGRLVLAQAARKLARHVRGETAEALS